MPRRPAKITQAEVKRILKGALSAGLKVSEVRFDENGLRLLTVGPSGGEAREGQLGQDEFSDRLQRIRKRGAR